VLRNAESRNNFQDLSHIKNNFSHNFQIKESNAGITLPPINRLSAVSQTSSLNSSQRYGTNPNLNGEIGTQHSKGKTSI